MKLLRTCILPLLLLLPMAAACGGSSNPSTGAGANGTTSNNGGGGSAGDGGASGGAGGAPTGGAGGSTSTSNGGSAGAGGSPNGGSGGGGSGGSPNGGSAGAGGSPNGGAGGGGGAAVLDPSMDGPYQTTTTDDSVTSGKDKVPIHCVYPTSGPEAGPYPVVVIAHGFQLPASQYYKYAERLATFGYVALTADFPTSLFSQDNQANAADLIAGLDWAKSKLPDKANTDLAGVTGHSLGGKLSILAATKDPRFKAAIELDPVDGGGGPGGGCNPPACVDASALMPNLKIPTGFLGETTDAMGGFQPCAPADQNYETFYKGANSPSFAVTIKGANHMSFLDDVASCGFTCSLCNMASLPNATVNGMARAYVVAFYERYLRNNAGYDTYLTGAKAQELYVTPGTATIESK